MHPMFTIPELVERIVFFVSTLPEDTSRITKRSSRSSSGYLPPGAYVDIVSLGLTASLFREPSLDQIWRTQTSLIPLLRSVMPISRRVNDYRVKEKFYVRDSRIPTLCKLISNINSTGLATALNC